MPRLQFKNQQSHKEHLVILIYFFLTQNIKEKKKRKVRLHFAGWQTYNFSQILESY